MKILDAWESEDGSELVLTVCGRPAKHDEACEWDLGPDAFPRKLVEAPPKKLTAPLVGPDGLPLPLADRAYRYEDDETRLNRAIRTFKGRFDARKPSTVRERPRRQRPDLVGVTA